MITALLASAPATDNQLAIQLLVELLLLALPCRQAPVLVEVGLMRLAMDERRKRGQVRVSTVEA
jgi:hypothetical protein